MAYFLATKCKGCDQQILVEPVQTREVRFQKARWYDVTCPDCGEKQRGLLSVLPVIEVAEESHPQDESPTQEPPIGTFQEFLEDLDSIPDGTIMQIGDQQPVVLMSDRKSYRLERRKQQRRRLRLGRPARTLLN